MKLVTLDCTKCGAPLEGWAGRKRFRCEYCGTSVLVSEARKARQQDGDEAAPAGKLFPSEAHQRLHDLDRRWRRERAHLVSRKEDGSMVVPKNADAILGGGLITLLGFGLLGRTDGVLVAVLCMLAGLAFALYGLKRARAYESAYRSYRQRRRRVLGEIAEQRS